MKGEAIDCSFRGVKERPSYWQYSDIDEEIGHWKTSDASDALTSKQQFVSESGFSEGFIKQIAALCHYFDEFENYRQNERKKGKWLKDNFPSRVNKDRRSSSDTNSTIRDAGITPDESANAIHCGYTWCG